MAGTVGSPNSPNTPAEISPIKPSSSFHLASSSQAGEPEVGKLLQDVECGSPWPSTPSSLEAPQHARDSHLGMLEIPICSGAKTGPSVCEPTCFCSRDCVLLNVTKGIHNGYYCTASITDGIFTGWKFLGSFASNLLTYFYTSHPK